MTRPLGTFEDGAYVRKPNATPFDYAFNRVGQVIREEVDGNLCLGVLWSGTTLVIEYPDEIQFERAEPTPRQLRERIALEGAAK